MVRNWTMVSLGDVVDLLTGYPFESKDYTEAASDPRLLRGDNVAQGWLRWDGVKRWPRKLLMGLDAYWLQQGDVILAMDRPWIEAGLKYAVVQTEDMPCLLVQRVARLRGLGCIETSFLRYVIGSPLFTNHVLAVQTGTSVPHISPTQIKEFKFCLPPLHEQRIIAATLGALDDKIELNRRMNETLAAMERALFKIWFIDYDPVRARIARRAPFGMDTATTALFPSGFMNGIPSGWRVLPLDVAATFLNGLALQNYPVGNNEPSLPILKISQLRAGSVKGSDRANLGVPESHRVDDGDLIFSWSGSLLVRLWAGGPAALNQHLFKVSSPEFPRWFIHQWLLEHLPAFQTIAADKATTMGHIQRHHLTAARIVAPGPEVLRATGSVIEPIEACQLLNEKQSQTLATLRDLLLPKLLSGELHVRDAEREVEKVA